MDLLFSVPIIADEGEDLSCSTSFLASGGVLAGSYSSFSLTSSIL